MHSDSDRLLVFEPQSGGHHGDFIREMLIELRRRGSPCEVRLVLGHGFMRQNSDLTEPLAQAAAEVRELPEGVPVADWPDVLRRQVEEWKPSAVLLFELTPFETWLGRHPLGVPVSGILFVQYPELDGSVGPWPRRVERRLRFWVKEWKTARWLRRQVWRTVFLLNGERACAYLNGRFPDTPVFRPLPDPAPAVAPGPVREFTGPRPEVRFVFPGTLSRRKGADVFLRALEFLRPDTAARSVFACAGPAEVGDRPCLERAVRRLRRRRPDVRLEWRDGYLSEAELQEAFRQADWILMPYRRSEYSSGILARAVAADRAVIGPDDGLLGRLIRDGGLGLTAAVSPRSFARALEYAAGTPFRIDPEKRAEFLERSRPEDFARRLLDGALGRSDTIEKSGKRSED